MGVTVLGLTKQLLDLQQADLKVHEVLAHIERLAAQGRQVEAKISQERAELAARREALQKLDLDSRSRNLEVDELDSRIRGYQERLDKGIISFKEMEDLRAKIASERVRISHLEDEALALMTAVETSRGDVTNAQADHAPREERLRSQVANLGQEIQETRQGQLAQLQGERATLAAALPPYALAQYETLRATFSNPIAGIDHGTCGGCKIRVSANTLERVRAGREIVTCEHCSRILYSL
jgi:predicted  nucleic acid-binding Zn-ribbon protein